MMAQNLRPKDASQHGREQKDRLQGCIYERQGDENPRGVRKRKGREFGRGGDREEEWIAEGEIFEDVEEKVVESE